MDRQMLEEQKFNRFSISLQDFSKAQEFLIEARKHPYGSLIHEALVFSALVCYYRPFTPNEKNPEKSPAASKLELSDFPALTPEESDIHNRCKELRNKALAHAEYKYHPTALDRETGVIASTIFSLVGQAPNLDSLSKLVEKLMQHCHNMRADYVLGHSPSFVDTRT